MHGHIILSHGSGSGPEATKVSMLAAVAESLGWGTQRPDYREDDTRGHEGSVAPRLARLRAMIEALDKPPVLVGSSMGAFVSGLVSMDIPVAGLFLLATPSEIPGYPRRFDLRAGVPGWLSHGWRDEICPLQGIYAFAAARRIPLMIFDDDHRLSASQTLIAAHFSCFLAAAIKSPAFRPE